MSPLLKNEVRLSLGSRHSSAGLWRAGWTARCIGKAESHGGDGAAIERLLARLRETAPALPRRATVCVDDEWLHYALLPATGSWRQADLAARRHFADILGDDSRLVARQLLPGARQWLVVALDGALVTQWHDTLADQGIGLRKVQAALLQDLWRCRGDLPQRDGVVAVLRRHGVALAGFQGGELHSLGWERCDMDQPQIWIDRIQAFRARLALATAPRALADPGLVRLLTANPAQQVIARGLAVPLGWQLIDDRSTEPLATS